MNASMPEDMRRGYQDAIDEIKRFTPFLPLLAHLGILRTIVHEQQKDYKLLPELLTEITFFRQSRKRCGRLAAELGAGMDDALDPRQVRTSGSSPGVLGDLPLIVLTAGLGDAPEAASQELNFDKVFVTDLQVRLARLSTKGRQIVVNSFHFIPFEQPRVVIDAIREVREATVVHAKYD